MTAPYRVVDPVERARRILGAFVVVPVVVLLYTVPVVLFAPMSIGFELTVASSVFLSACGLSLVLAGTRASGRELAAVEVGPDGVHLRAERSVSRRRVLVPWSEIASVAVSPTAPEGDAAPGAPEVRRWLALSDVLGEGTLDGRRWRTGPRRVRVVVGLRPGSVAQDDEFGTRIAVVYRQATRRPDTPGIDGLADALFRWQERWTRVEQPVGLHVDVPERVLDEGRLQAAVEAFRPGLPFSRLPPLPDAELDTPHDVATFLARTLRGTPRSR